MGLVSWEIALVSALQDATPQFSSLSPGGRLRRRAVRTTLRYRLDLRPTDFEILAPSWALGET